MWLGRVRGGRCSRWELSHLQAAVSGAVGNPLLAKVANGRCSEAPGRPPGPPFSAPAAPAAGLWEDWDVPAQVPGQEARSLTAAGAPSRRRVDARPQGRGCPAGTVLRAHISRRRTILTCQSAGDSRVNRLLGNRSLPPKWVSRLRGHSHPRAWRGSQWRRLRPQGAEQGPLPGSQQTRARRPGAAHLLRRSPA